MMGTIKRDTMACKKGQIIFREGDAANCMYDIRWGTVGIYANYGTSREKLLTTLHPEEYFGEMGLVDQAPRSATAVALERETTLEIIDRESFGSFLQERPAKVLMIMKHMSHRIRTLTDDYLEACGTVTKAMESEEKGEAKSAELQEKIDRFNEVYQASVKDQG